MLVIGGQETSSLIISVMLTHKHKKSEERSQNVDSYYFIKINFPRGKKSEYKKSQTFALIQTLFNILRGSIN